MKKEIIRPNRARAVGVITPPLAEMLALDEEVNTNHFHDVRVIRNPGPDNTYKGVTRKTQTLMGDKLEVDIVVDSVKFYKEHPEQGWFGLSVYVAGTDTRVNRGNLKIYVRDVDGVMDADVLIKEYNIQDSISLGWQISNLNWQDVLDAFTAKNAHPFRCFNVKVVYTDNTHYYMNKTVYPPRRICYATHPILNVYVTNHLPAQAADYENNNLEALSIDMNETPLVNRTYTLELYELVNGTAHPKSVRLAFELLDGLGERIRKVPFSVKIQDTQETHTINGTTYGLSGDMDIGTYQGTTVIDGMQCFEQHDVLWSYLFTREFMATSESRNRRHVFTTVFFGLDDNLFTGGDGLRSGSGFEFRIRWDYMQPVTFNMIEDASSYGIRNFHYFFNVVDDHGNNVPCKILPKVNGITIHDSNDQPLLFERDVQTNVFEVEFDYPYLHSGNNDVRLSVVTDYDYEKTGHTITANLPQLHYMISVPTITGSFGDAGRVTLEYTVGTIENDELPYCNIWDLKLNDETLVARDKTLIGGEWNGEYHSIIGTKATNLVSSNYNTNTGKLTIVVDVQELNAGDYTLKLVLPETDAIQGGNNTSTFTVQQRDPLRHILTIDENWKRISKLNYSIDVANPPSSIEYIHANTDTNTLLFNVPGTYYVYLASLQDLFTYYNNEFSLIAYKGGSNGKYELGFMKYALDANDNHLVDSNSIYRLGYVAETYDVNVLSEETNYSQTANEVLFRSWNEFKFQKIGNNIHIWYCSQGTTSEHFTIPIGNMNLSRYYLYTGGDGMMDASLYLTTTNQSLIDYPSDYTDTRAETELVITDARYISSTGTITATANLKTGNTILKGSTYTVQVLFDSRYPEAKTPDSSTGNILYTVTGGLTSGTHTVKFKFEGNEDYKPCTITTNILVP